MPGPASSSGPGAVGTHAAAPPFNRLAKLRAEVTPPEYARAVGAEGESLRDPVTITALAGSEVTVSGVGSAQGLEAGSTRLRSTLPMTMERGPFDSR